MTTEALAGLSGILTVAAVMTIGLIARQGPSTRRAPGSPAAPAAAACRTRRLAIIAAATTASGAAIAIAGPVGAIAVATGGVGAWTRSRRHDERRCRAAVEATFPDAVELLVLCLHAGRSPVQAVHELARRAPIPVRPGFAAVTARMQRGAALADALTALPETLGPTAQEVAASVAAADREGLALAPVLDRLAADARTARRRQGDAAARRLPVRLSFPLVACTLPAFVLAALAPALLGALSTLRGGSP
ncbi:MAG: type II secretion system F family protein [Desertimonas sp.]